MSQESCELSVVVTVFNDATMIGALVEKLIPQLESVTKSHEIILVNDCSRDHSAQAIAELAKRYPFVKGISLSRNFGQQIAVSAGLHYAKGRYVIVMDSDMHDTVTAIPELYAKIRQGFDIVYTVSKVRDKWLNSLASSFFWFLVKIFRVKMVPHQLMLRIMTADFVRNFVEYGELNRTIAGICADISTHHGVLEVEGTRRSYGTTNYRFITRFHIFIDLIFSITVAPLNFLIYLGSAIFAMTVLASAYYLFLYLTTSLLPGFTSILLSIFFFGSTTIIILGLIGRYLSNILTEVRRRPLFLVREKYNLE